MCDRRSKLCFKTDLPARSLQVIKGWDEGVAQLSKGEPPPVVLVECLLDDSMRLEQDDMISKWFANNLASSNAGQRAKLTCTPDYAYALLHDSSPSFFALFDYLVHLLNQSNRDMPLQVWAQGFPSGRPPSRLLLLSDLLHELILHLDKQAFVGL